MPRKVVVTGGGGFVGQWLARALLGRGDSVILVGREDAPSSPAILSKEEWAAVRWIRADVRSSHDLQRCLTAASPDLIFHLAGMSFVPQAEGAPAVAYEVNVIGIVRLLEATLQLRSIGNVDPLVLVVGSATQYGAHAPAEMPLDESAEQRPASAYAATKAAQEIAALQMARTLGLRVVCTRSFSHSGVGHAASFLLPSLVARVRDLQGGAPLRIGNDVIRDYLHVDDVVDAYLTLGEHGIPGEVYNVASGIGVSVRDLATAVVEIAGVRNPIISDPALQRAVDAPVLIGSAEKLRRATGWRPKKTFRDILRDLLMTNPG